MTTIQTTDIIVATVNPAVTVAAGDLFYLLSGVRVTNSGGGRALRGAADARFMINGEVIGLQGIDIVGAANTTSSVTVGVSGLVAGDNDGVVLETAGRLDVTNRGQIFGLSQSGIQYFGGSGGTVVNYGLISGGASGIEVNAGQVSIYNFGEISGGAAAGISVIYFSSFTGSVFNRGTMRGDVQFGSGNDLYDGDGGIVLGVISGGGGNDTLIGGAGAETLRGGLGADRIIGGDGLDTADFSITFNFVGAIARLDFGVGLGGDAEGDIYVSIENLTGSTFNDLLVGNSVDNVINGSNGDDHIFGLGGADLLIGGAGADTLEGGDGIDTIDFSPATSGVTIRLDFGVGQSGDALGDVYIGIENVVGTTSSDFIVGDGADNIINGGDGFDRLFGLGGDDALLGGDGNDTLDGGAGADVLTGGGGSDYADYSNAAAPVTVRFDFGIGLTGDAAGDTYSGIENIIGSGLNDFLVGEDGSNNIVIGGAGADTMFGLAGFDTLAGGAGADTFDGGGGNDTVDFTFAASGVTARLDFGVGLAGEAAGDVYISMENIAGSTFADVLIGDANSNSISGLGGADTIFGLGGSDVLTGGAGADVFGYLSTLEGNDSITDFVSGTDKIGLSLAAFNMSSFTLGVNFFSGGAPAPVSAAPTLLFNTGTGQLSYDSNGTGAGGLVNLLQVSTTLSAGDFMVL